MRYAIICASLLGLTLVGAAQDNVKEEKKSKSTPGAAEAVFADGSTIRLVVLAETIEVTTKYGKLSVPLADVRRIDFAYRVPEDVERRLQAAAAKLGSDDFKEREAASEELLSLKEYVGPILERLIKSEDKEISRRAREILATLQERISEEKLRAALVQHDTVVTDQFSIPGKIELKTLKARTPYFGEVTMKLSDLRSLRFAPGEGAERDLVVDAGKFGMPNPVWMDTGVEVTSNTKLELRASGIVDLYPVPGDTGMYRVGPAGNKTWGIWKGDSVAGGVLVGRIGEKGKVFEIGEKFEGTPGESGKLYLRIGPSPWGNPSAGEFKVKLTLR
jgi:hypothetical protein